MKKQLLLFAALIIILLFCACESTLPLYRAYKTDMYDNFYDDDYVKENIYEDTEQLDSYFHISNSEIISISDEKRELLENQINEILQKRFEINYKDTTDFEDFINGLAETDHGWENIEEMIQNIKSNYVIFRITTANLIPNNYVKQYYKDNQELQAVYINITLNVTSHNVDFFNQYPFLYNGDNTVTAFILFKCMPDRYELIGWQEVFHNDTNFEFYYVK